MLYFFYIFYLLSQPKLYDLKLFPYAFVRNLMMVAILNMLILYLVHITALMPLYKINTDKCIHILLKHFINTIRYSNMLRPLKDHLQGV